MKKFVKAMCLVFGLVLMFAACGCGDKGKDTGEITMFKWDFASLNSARRQNTAIYNKLKEKNGGYELKSVTCGYGDWEQTINNFYNTGNLPDVFINYTVDRPQIFQKMIRDGAVLNWDNYVNKDNYPNIYARLHEYDWLLERLDYLENKHYFLPITIKQTHVMFVRQDWINNLNAKLAKILVSEKIINSESEMTNEIYEANKFVLPETLTEFYRLSKAFTIYDPDNNGSKDTYGYTCSGDLMWYNNWVFQAMGGTYWGWEEDGNGGLTASWITDANKKAVAFLNRLYEEGIMDPDYTAMTDATKISNFCSNRTGIMVDNVYYNTYVEQLRAANNMTREQAKAAIAVIAPPKGENGDYGMRGNPGFWCGTCISGDLASKRMENKRKAIFDMLEFMLGEEGYDTFTYGVEGTHYKVNAEGVKESLMGVDSNGCNITAKGKDAAFDIHMFVDWSLSYNPGFSTDYDEVRGYMQMAEECAYVDKVNYVQTPLVIDGWDNIGQESFEYFIRLISTDYKSYNKNVIGNVTYDSLLLSSSSDYDSDWSTFTNRFLNTWGGRAMINEYSAEGSKYLT